MKATVNDQNKLTIVYQEIAKFKEDITIGSTPFNRG